MLQRSHGWYFIILYPCMGLPHILLRAARLPEHRQRHAQQRQLNDREQTALHEGEVRAPQRQAAAGDQAQQEMPADGQPPVLWQRFTHRSPTSTSSAQNTPHSSRKGIQPSVQITFVSGKLLASLTTR